MTLIDKAEALLPCPFCGGEAELNDCLVECRFCLCAVPNGFGYEGERLGYATNAEAIAAWNTRAALPARGVGVKPLLWQPTYDGAGNLHRVTVAYCPVFEMNLYAERPEDQPRIDAKRAARILAAIEPTTEKGGDAHAFGSRHAPHEASPSVTAGADAAQTAGERLIEGAKQALAYVRGEANVVVVEHVFPDAAQAREAAMQELIAAYEDIMDYGIVFAKKEQQDRLKAAKEKLNA